MDDLKIPKFFTVKELFLQCEWNSCNQNFNDVLPFVSHIENDHICKEFSGDISKILKRQHDYNISSLCKWTKCDYVADYASELLRHIYFHAFHTKLKSIGKTLIDLQTQQCAMDSFSSNIIPEPLDPIKCQWFKGDCDFQTENYIIFYQHVQQHIDLEKRIDEDILEKRYHCDWKGCNNEFRYKNKLEEHVRSHTQEKVIACPNCGCLYASRAKFLDHIRRQVTEDNQRYLCQHCNKPFASQRILKAHSEYHTSSYKCPYCPQVCSRIANIKKHISYRHSNERPFKCPYCPSAFKALFDLQKHVDTVHNNLIATKPPSTGLNSIISNTSTPNSVPPLDNHISTRSSEIANVCNGTIHNTKEFVESQPTMLYDELENLNAKNAISHTTLQSPKLSICNGNVDNVGVLLESQNVSILPISTTIKNNNINSMLPSTVTLSEKPVYRCNYLINDNNGDILDNDINAFQPNTQNSQGTINGETHTSSSPHVDINGEIGPFNKKDSNLSTAITSQRVKPCDYECHSEQVLARHVRLAHTFPFITPMSHDINGDKNKMNENLAFVTVSLPQNTMMTNQSTMVVMNTVDTTSEISNHLENNDKIAQNYESQSISNFPIPMLMTNSSTSSYNANNTKICPLTYHSITNDCNNNNSPILRSVLQTTTICPQSTDMIFERLITSHAVSTINSEIGNDHFESQIGISSISPENDANTCLVEDKSPHSITHSNTPASNYESDIYNVKLDHHGDDTDALLANENKNGDHTESSLLKCVNLLETENSGKASKLSPEQIAIMNVHIVESIETVLSKVHLPNFLELYTFKRVPKSAHKVSDAHNAIVTTSTLNLNSNNTTKDIGNYKGPLNSLIKDAINLAGIDKVVYPSHHQKMVSGTVNSNNINYVPSQNYTMNGSNYGNFCSAPYLPSSNPNAAGHIQSQIYHNLDGFYNNNHHQNINNNNFQLTSPLQMPHNANITNINQYNNLNFNHNQQIDNFTPKSFNINESKKEEMFTSLPINPNQNGNNIPSSNVNTNVRIPSSTDNSVSKNGKTKKINQKQPKDNLVENCNAGASNESIIVKKRGANAGKKYNRTNLRYLCHMCDKKYSRSDKLSFHLQKVHKFLYQNQRFRYQLYDDGNYRIKPLVIMDASSVSNYQNLPKHITPSPSTNTGMGQKTPQQIKNSINKNDIQPVEFPMNPKDSSTPIKSHISKNNGYVSKNQSDHQLLVNQSNVNNSNSIMKETQLSNTILTSMNNITTNDNNTLLNQQLLQLQRGQIPNGFMDMAQLNHRDINFAHQDFGQDLQHQGAHSSNNSDLNQFSANFMLPSLFVNGNNQNSNTNSMNETSNILNQINNYNNNNNNINAANLQHFLHGGRQHLPNSIMDQNQDDHFRRQLLNGADVLIAQSLHQQQSMIDFINNNNNITNQHLGLSINNNNNNNLVSPLNHKHNMSFMSTGGGSNGDNSDSAMNNGTVTGLTPFSSLHAMHNNHHNGNNNISVPPILSMDFLFNTNSGNPFDSSSVNSINDISSILRATLDGSNSSPPNNQLQSAEKLGELEHENGEEKLLSPLFDVQRIAASIILNNSTNGGDINAHTGTTNNGKTDGTSSNQPNHAALLVQAQSIANKLLLQQQSNSYQINNNNFNNTNNVSSKIFGLGNNSTILSDINITSYLKNIASLQDLTHFNPLTNMMGDNHQSFLHNTHNSNNINMNNNINSSSMLPTLHRMHQDEPSTRESNFSYNNLIMNNGGKILSLENTSSMNVNNNNNCNPMFQNLGNNGVLQQPQNQIPSFFLGAGGGVGVNTDSNRRINMGQIIDSNNSTQHHENPMNLMYRNIGALNTEGQQLIGIEENGSNNMINLSNIASNATTYHLLNPIKFLD